LETWLGLEPGVGQAGLSLLDGPDEGLHGVVTAGVSPLPQAIPDPGRRVVIFSKIVLDRLEIWRQDRFPPLGLVVSRELVAGQVSAYGFAVESELFSDRPDALSASMHGLDIHVYLLRDHRVSPPLLEETILLIQSPDGTLFVPITGTFLHSH